MKYVRDELNIKIYPRMHNNAGRKSEHVATFRLVGSFEPPWLRLSRLIKTKKLYIIRIVHEETASTTRNC